MTIEQQTPSPELHVHPGGQGVWQARMIAALSTPVVLCCALGGETGDVLGRQLAAEPDVQVRTVRRRSGTGWYVHDRRDGSRSVVAEHPGDPLERHDLDELNTLALTEGLRVPVAGRGGAVHGPRSPTHRAGIQKSREHRPQVRRVMTEPAATGAAIDTETALRREVDALAQRFPDVDPAELDERVHATYERLKHDATVDSHLIAMTEKQVTEELRERGETVHVRGEDAG